MSLVTGIPTELLEITLRDGISSKLSTVPSVEQLESPQKDRIASEKVTENADHNALAYGERKRSRRAGHGGCGSTSGVLPGVHQVRQPRQG